MSHHKQEPTTYSLTGTVVDHGDKKVPSLPPGFLPQVTASNRTLSDSPQDTPGKPGSHGLEEKPGSSSLASIIPLREKDDPRTLVLCFDGTEDQFDDDNSNIVHFVKLLAKKDRTKQMVYYQVFNRQPKISLRLTDASPSRLD